MRLGNLWTLFGKEVLSTLRDRRAVTSTLIMPLILMPLFVVGFPLLFGNLTERETETVSLVALQGADALPEALSTLLRERNVRPEAVDDARQAVQDDAYAAGFSLAADFAAQIAANDPVTVQVYSKAGNIKSELVAGKVRDALSAYRQRIVAERLRAEGLDARILEPITLETVDASTPAEQGAGLLGWLIPYFIAIFTLTGGQVTAIDATAGEKERGTLESLLVAPVGRFEVVLGKALATMLFGLVASLVGIGSYMLSGLLALSVLGGGDMGTQLTGTLNFSLSTLALLAISSLLMAALVASLLVGVAMFARSYKQAQSYIAPLTFVMILPALGLQFADFFIISDALYAVPLFNILLLMNDAVKGGATLGHLLITWGSSLLYALLCLLFAYRNFRREGVIFRT